MSSAPGVELERSIDSIQIGARHRTDLGDLESLAESIRQHGLLQPITVTPEGLLVCGRRRLEALRLLGMRKVNVWVRAGISGRLTELLAEQDENTLHKGLTLTETATLYAECKKLLSEDASRRQKASRFGSPSTPGMDGAVTVTAPQTTPAGDARVQAAVITTGKQARQLDSAGGSR
ncbi:ParB N-terminal domain-containing protein [Microbacterium sp. C7(2022)]|uniref:ParB N-terminal domain-containing protein n=1 Tax=Microbacterium sp. C7(2022) TaxID=2992759 RepID=UPI00237AF8A7|nr:ParB N-terminal domain-containing protein [Microbacterium sp. C7(2022)]MDE0545935.1 ParB N-terminal domain-containing protein [Microbacterium sp. C7(2022)]